MNLICRLGIHDWAAYRERSGRVYNRHKVGEVCGAVVYQPYKNEICLRCCATRENTTYLRREVESK